MMLTVQVRLDEEEPAIQLSEINEWLDRLGCSPRVFQHMAFDGDLLGLDFDAPSEAATFADAFGGVVLAG